MSLYCFVVSTYIFLVIIFNAFLVEYEGMVPFEGMFYIGNTRKLQKISFYLNVTFIFQLILTLSIKIIAPKSFSFSFVLILVANV